MAYEIDKRLVNLTVRELPLNRRQQLSSYLNGEQVLMADCGLARDYRGLAQQLEWSYGEMAQLEKYYDPCGSLLGDQRAAKLSVYDLFELLANIGRFDVLDDMIPVLVQEIQSLQKSKNQHELVRTIPDQSTIWYDAYVCYADSDLDFVRRLVEHLESPEIGFRLFVRDRDLLGGHWAYETFAQLIETQCRRMIVVISPDFLESHDCKFQSMFATGLAIEKCSRILVPIIYKPCGQLPSILRLMSKIDMTNSDNDNRIPEWSMKRLIMSIREQRPPATTTRISGSNNKPAIEYPLSNNQNISPEPVLNNQEPEIQLMETISTRPIATTATTISVISNDSSDESTRPLIPEQSTSQQHSYSAIEHDGHDNNNAHTKNKWIKSLKKKIKVNF